MSEENPKDPSSQPLSYHSHQSYRPTRTINTKIVASTIQPYQLPWLGQLISYKNLFLPLSLSLSLMPSGNLQPKRSSASLKAILATRLIGALCRINQQKPSSSTISSSAIIKRSRRIKLTAYASMAYAAGSNRAWSRALIYKLRRRARFHGSDRLKALVTRRSKEIRPNKGKSSERNLDCGTQPLMSRADRLRCLVPGGKGMDFCTLLDETADYVHFLATQVQVMKGIADSLDL